MFRYILTYGEYEDTVEIELLHSTKFTQEEFNKLVKKSMAEMFDNSSIGKDILLLRDLMIKNFGFEHPNKIQSSYYCGSYGNWNLF
jgi:hypothetical protein